MVRIYSPDRAELQDAFANRFKRIVQKQNRLKVVINWIRDMLLLFCLFLLAVTIAIVLLAISGI